MTINFVSRNTAQIRCDHCKHEIAKSHPDYIEDVLHQCGGETRIKKYHPVDIRRTYLCEDCSQLSDDVIYNTEEN